MAKTRRGVHVKVELNVWCKRCGTGLCKQTYPRRNHPNIIDVEPCQKCIDAEVAKICAKHNITD